MQNRSMFPYRRHGSKKRTKGGGGPMRKPRGPQKGLPNSARDLLPMLQPATKALAQMLAGRTAASGQLEQARAMLGQAERLIADRVHNRLNPAEREEFFEQLARLRLTLADAADEAEARAAEEQAPPRPQAPPVPQERLMEMALALASPEAARRRRRQAPRAPARRLRRSTSRSLPRQTMRRPQLPPRRRSPTRAAPRSRSARRPRPRGRAGCTRSTGAAGWSCRGMPRRTPRRPCRSGAAGRLPGAAARRSTRWRCRRRPPRRGPAADAGPGDEQQDGNGVVAEAAEKKTPRRSRKTQTGLPEGWIIDEEGFVVPGPR